MGKKFATFTNSDVMNALSVTAGDIIIWVGVKDNCPFLMALDTSGNIQWQRRVRASGGGNGSFKGIIHDKVNKLFLLNGTYNGSGQEVGSNDWLIAALPMDGSGLGTYGGVFIYEQTSVALVSNTSNLLGTTMPSSGTWTITVNNTAPGVTVTSNSTTVKSFK